MLVLMLAIVSVCAYLVQACFQWLSACTTQEMAPADRRMLAPRAHYLCEKAWDIETMPHNWERMQADTQWRADLQQYIADHSKSVSKPNAANVFSLPAKKQQPSN